MYERHSTEVLGSEHDSTSDVVVDAHLVKGSALLRVAHTTGICIILRWLINRQVAARVALYPTL
jgi:hypothetical protein